MLIENFEAVFYMFIFVKTYDMSKILKCLSSAVAFLLILLMLLSCNKTYNCSHDYYHMPVFVSFINFNQTKIVSLVLKKYHLVNGQKVNLIASDTTFHPTLVFVGDTAHFEV